MTRHLRTLADLTADEIKKILERAEWLKINQRAGKTFTPLAGKTLAMIFEKPSTRTRVSFEVAMFQLGGHAINLTSQGSQLGRGETYADTSRVLSRYVQGIMIRTFAQDSINEIAKYSSVPVINGLTDLAHPCQVLTDLFTVYEEFGAAALGEVKVAYVGDGNNMTYSWALASMILGFPLSIATPKGFELNQELTDKIKKEGHKQISFTNDPHEAVKDALVINTDTWVSMGQEGAQEAEKKKTFEPYQINRKLVESANSKAIVLHCLPAHRGEEITNDVMDGPKSRVFDQAENRLHAQKSILEFLMG